MWNLIATGVSIAAGAVGLFGLIVTYLHNSEANQINRFEVTLKGFELRIADLEHELGIVKQALITEQCEHTKTRKVRDAALRYIREVLTWRDRRIPGPMPTPTAALQAEL